jgi:hypothetical protein
MSCSCVFRLVSVLFLHAVVPIIYTSRDDPEEKLRALKRSLQQQEAASSSSVKGFGRSGSSSSGQQWQPGESGSGIGNSEVSLTEDDKKWRLEATAVDEWEVRAAVLTQFLPWGFCKHGSVTSQGVVCVEGALVARFGSWLGKAISCCLSCVAGLPGRGASDTTETQVVTMERQHLCLLLCLPYP